MGLEQAGLGHFQPLHTVLPVPNAELEHGGQRIAVGSELVLGRHRDCGLQIKTGGASRQHAKLGCTAEGRYWIEDLGSANGTRVNGKKIEHRTILRSGDRITIGEAELTFHGESDRSARTEAAVPSPPAPRTPTPRPEAKAKAKSSAGSEPSHRPITRTHPREPFKPAKLLEKLIDGYRILEILGTGTVSTVYKARQLSLDRPVGFKVIDPSIASAASPYADQIINEARQAGKLQHKGIAQVHECGDHEGLLWIATEFVEGDTLEELIERDGRIDLNMALLVAERVGQALHAAHEAGIVHRDIKPDNIHISKTGAVKVLNMGIVGAIQDARRGDSKSKLVGAPRYMSPEQARGEKPAPASDIYSLGCTLFHMITGRPPYDGRHAAEIIKKHADEPVPQVSEIITGVPAQLDELLTGMMAKNPEWRFTDFDEWLRDVGALRAMVSTGGTTAPTVERTTGGNEAIRTPGPRSRPSNQAYRREKGPPIATLIVIGAIVVGGLIAWPRVKQMMAQPQANNAITTTPPAETTPPPVAATPATPDTASPDPEPTPTPPTPAGDPLRDAWLRTTAAVDAHREANHWGSAEYELQRFITLAANTPGTALDAAAQSKLRQVRIDADRWYQQSLSGLPPETQPRDRVTALAAIRRDVPSRSRSDAEARYRQAIQLLERELATTRREVVKALEMGDVASLPAHAQVVAAQFRNTPVAGLYDSFATLAREASQLPWQGDWPTTRQWLPRAQGEQALGAAAALILIGDREAAVRLLLDNEAALAQGELATRRRSLLESNTLLLGFDDPSDLTWLLPVVGDIRIADGHLTAPADEPVSFSPKAQLGGQAWEADVDWTMVVGEDEVVPPIAVVSIVSQGDSLISVRMEGANVTVTAIGADGKIEQSTDIDNPGRYRLRLQAVDSTLRIILNDETLFEGAISAIPRGATMRIDATDADWRLDELRLIGG